MGCQVTESHARSIAKAVCWRILASMDTFGITLLVTGSIVKAGSIASIESVSKIALYYLHERAWTKLRWDGDLSARLVVVATRKLARLRQLDRVAPSSSLQCPGEASK